MKFSDIMLILALIYIGLGFALLPKYAIYVAKLPFGEFKAVVLPYLLIFTGLVFIYIQFRERGIKTKVKRELATRIFREK